METEWKQTELSAATFVFITNTETLETNTETNTIENG